MYEGDTLITGSAGIAQVRMRDGALLSLRKGTEFRIEEFRFEEAQAEQDAGRGFFALLRGGFRTITGLLGRRNRQNYRVSTPVATIGIRGTHYGLRLCQGGDCAAEGVEEDGLYGGVVDGSISADNQAGPSVFGNDEYFHVASAGSRADSLLTPPGVVFGPDLPAPAAAPGADAQARLQRNLRQLRTALSSQAPEAALLDFLNRQVLLERAVLNNRTTDDPRVRVIIDQLQQFLADLGASGGRVESNSALALAMLLESPVDDSFVPLVLGVRTDGDPAPTENLTVVDAAGSPIYSQQVQTGNCADAVCTVNAIGATPTATGADAALGVRWGRWDDNWSLRVSGLGQEEAGSAHFMMASNITSPAELGLRNATQAFYTVPLGGTAPTSQNGDAGVLNSLIVEVDFGAQQVVGYDLNITTADTVGTITAGIAGNQRVDFGPAAAGEITLLGSCSGGECGNLAGVSGRASTVFVGDGAEALMSAYGLRGVGDDGNFGYTGTALVGEEGSIRQE